jgi:hypothetical protein
MSHSLRIVGAGLLLFAVIGCSLDSFLAAPGGPSANKQIVNAPVAQVSARLEEGLSEAGVSVLTKQVGQERRLAGITPSGKIFCLHLYGQKVAGKEATQVRVKWDREADEAFWRMVLNLAASSAADTGDLSAPGDAN